MLKRKMSFVSIALVIVGIFSCTGAKKFVLEKPQDGMSLVVGAVLIENNGIEDVYEAKTSKITVVIVGKSVIHGVEKTAGYRIKTDENGYFALQNVPPGAYIIKGFEADLGYQTHYIATSRWNGNTQVFYPFGGMIDFTVRNWPEPVRKKIIDMQINYFMVDKANRIAHKKYKSLKNGTGQIPNKKYTMVNPVEYYRLKYPQCEWFKE